MDDSSLRKLQTTCGAAFSLVTDSHGDGASRPAAPPLHFGDPAAEYLSATTNAALFDLSNHAQIEITGDDRAKFLHNFCTNDIKGLIPGNGCEAFVTNIKGRILGHIFVFDSASSLWLESVPGSEEPLLAHLDRYIITEDVQLHPRTGDFAELYVCGPRAAEKLSQLLPSVESLQTMQHATGSLADTEVAVRRVDFTPVPGFLLTVSRLEAAALWQAIQNIGVMPAGSQAFEALRIEAGMPWYGVDLTDDNLAQEAGRTSRAISFKKGCYLGQEPIARLDAMGHVNRELRGLRLDALPVPPIGSKVVSPADGSQIGTITSAALSYTDNRPAALAVLRSQFTKPGTEVAVIRDDDGAPTRATVFWPEKN